MKTDTLMPGGHRSHILAAIVSLGRPSLHAWSPAASGALVASGFVPLAKELT